MCIKFVSIGHLPKEREVLSFKVCLEWRKICKYVSALGGGVWGAARLEGRIKERAISLHPNNWLVAKFFTISYNTVAQWAILSLNTPI